MKGIDEIISKRIEDVCKIPVYPVIAKGEPKYPYITYTLEQWEAQHSKDGLIGFWSEYEIEIFTETYDEGNKTVASLIESIGGYRDNTITQCRILGGGIGYGECFINFLKLKITHGR